MDITKQEFINKQNRIYEEIKENERHLKKLEPISFNNQGGYIIALRQSDEVVETIEKFNSRIELIIPIMKYDQSNIHTTMATYQVQDNFEPDEKVLLKMVDVFKDENLPVMQMKIDYNQYLLDSSAIILSGSYCEAFFDNCKNIISALQSENLFFKYPWGTRITACRFLEKGNEEQIAKIKIIIEEYKNKLRSVPPQIDVGYYKNDGKTFELYSSFKYKLK